MQLHKFTKRFIRFLKEENVYITFLDYIRKKYYTHYPLKTLNSKIEFASGYISSDLCISSILDTCFNWHKGPLPFEKMDELFAKASQIDKDFNYIEK